MPFKYSLGAKLALMRDLENLDSGILELELKGGWDRDKRMGQMLGYTVIERILQECVGGEQRHYLCRFRTAEGYATHRFSEFELAPFPTVRVVELMTKIMTVGK